MSEPRLGEVFRLPLRLTGGALEARGSALLAALRFVLFRIRRDV